MRPGYQAPAISGGASLGDALSCCTGGWKSNLDVAFLFRKPRTFAYEWWLDGSPIPVPRPRASRSPSRATTRAG